MAKTKKKSKSQDYDKVFMMFSLVLGMLFGWISADSAGVPYVSEVLANVGIWMFTASLISIYSKTGIQAILHNIIFYAGGIVMYAAHMTFLSGMPDFRFLIYRCVLAFIGSLIGFITWNALQPQWLGAISGAVPVSLILAEGFPIIYSRSAVLAFDVVLAVALFFILLRGRERKLMAIPFVLAFTFAGVYFDIFSKLFGGWI